MAVDPGPAPAGVDFFDRQQRARGSTAKLLVLFGLAVAAVVLLIDLLVYLVVPAPSGRVGWMVVATVITVLIIGGGTLSKMASLRGGGPALAQSMGAVPVDPTTADPLLRRYINVVEEMAIASGAPMPALFVLPNDAGINAFAAGYSPADAAITVTHGALQTLNRDELQGVIGHEFSHILAGDMRINIRMIGVLGGLLVLGLVGVRILQFGGRGKNKGGGPILLFGVAAMVLGFVGQFLAGLIKAAVSRQREWLADAAAIQFTRQSAGLAGALKKIAGLPEGSALVDARSEKQVSHMLFGAGRGSILALWDTHPPLEERIRALDPTFGPEQAQALRERYAAQRPNGLVEDVALGFAPARAPASAPGPAAVPARASAIARSVGTFTLADLEGAAALSRQLDPQLRQLAGTATTAAPLVLALLMDPSAPADSAQARALGQALPPDLVAETLRLRPAVAGLTPQLRLPLVALALPALAARPPGQVEQVRAALHGLALADARYSLFEYCLTRMTAGYLADRLDPRRAAPTGRATLAQMRASALTVLSVVAATGAADPAQAQAAFDKGVDRLGLGPSPFAPPRDFVADLDASWAALDALDPGDKRRLVEALVVVSAHDGMLHVNEAQLLRTACALLHCPVPMLLT